MIHTPNSLTKSLQDNNLSFVPSITIRIEQLSRIPLRCLDFSDKSSMYNQVRRQLKTVANYTWDNGVLRLSNIFGHEFVAHISLSEKDSRNSNRWNIVVWDYTGNHHIGMWHKKFTDRDDCLSVDDVNNIHASMKAYSMGVSNCSDCSCKIPSSKNIVVNADRHDKEYGGQYFAGHYCIDCWNSKWKAIEAKETYD